VLPCDLRLRERAHHLTDIESIRSELRALRKHIANSASKALLEEADTMLSVTEAYVDAAVLTVRRTALQLGMTSRTNSSPNTTAALLSKLRVSRSGRASG
jgi:hypothetical protein